MDTAISLAFWPLNPEYAMHPLFTGVFFVYGAIIGSFLTVCADRIPKGQSIVRPGSRCRCGTPIPWYYNIPILAWILLRGRAKCCGSRIPVIYPITELFTGLLWMAGGILMMSSHSYGTFMGLLLLLGGPYITYTFLTKTKMLK